MKDIKFPIKVCVDYLPDDGILCSRCKYCEWCPVDYICKTLDRQLDEEYVEGCEE